MNDKIINIINVSEIKEVIVDKMLTCHIEKKSDEKESEKFFKFLNLLSKDKK